MDRERKKPRKDAAQNANGPSPALLERVSDFYHATLLDHAAARAFLRDKGLDDDALLSACRLGFSDGSLSGTIPDTGGVRDELANAGILRLGGEELLLHCVTVPLLDPDGAVLDLWGWPVIDEDPRRLTRSVGLWNLPAAAAHPTLILAAGIPDGLSLRLAGYPNACALAGGAPGPDVVRLLRELGVREVVPAGDRRTVERLAEAFRSFGRRRVVFEDGGPGRCLIERGAEALLSVVERCLESPPGPPEEDGPAGFPALRLGQRSYRVMSLDKAPGRLKVTLRAEAAGRLHVDTLDLYSARSRRALQQDLCRLFEQPPETVEADIGRLLHACETSGPLPQPAAADPGAASMTAAERKAAEAFGSAPDLAGRILADFETCGLVGEEANKLLCYLAAVSRRMSDPLSVLVLSSSGSGKTALQDMALSFVPPEDLVKLTSLTGKALFYKDRLALKHKVLALEEGAGAESAGYAIRNLISAGQLVIESTVRDSSSGRLTTMENRVEGPTAVFITTTDPDTDPETKSRFFVTSVDESPEQTRRILRFQRTGQTLEGLRRLRRIDEVLKLHRNFQRLLRPLAVVNPYAERLTYLDDRLQGRRDQPKYLNLIRAVAFLRQMQKPVREAEVAPGGDKRPWRYVEVDVQDIRIANGLAHEILGRCLDELSRAGRALLMLLDRMIDQRMKESEAPSTGGPAAAGRPRRSQIMFTRREVREYTGWAHTRVHRALKELVALEYVLLVSGRNGSLCRYRLPYDGQGKDGSRFMLGLIDVESLDREPNHED